MINKHTKIFLAGFMGTGKTTIGKILAKKLGWEFYDTDNLIEALSKKSISEIFAQQGERKFRTFERQAMDKVLHKNNSVVALGGGAVCSKANLRKLKKAGTLILLKASPEILIKRLLQSNTRPLLLTPSPWGEGARRADEGSGQSSQNSQTQLKKKIEALLKKRKNYYDSIAWQIQTDQATPKQIATQITQELPIRARALPVQLQQNPYPIYFDNHSQGIPSKLFNAILKQHCPTEKVLLVTNDKIDPLWGRTLAQGLRQSFKVHKVVLPDGERHKTLKTIQKLYDEFIKAKADRQTPVIALGGGVLGDTVGFAAASYLRGIPFVQIPTTLLAQVDSSVGGKTGVDLPEGKNLIGAFYQPKFVWINESFLSTLSIRQFRCGMAEVIKYAAIFDANLFRYLENNMESLLNSKNKGLEDVIRKCCAWKAWVVEKDERETSGLRSLLNFGHTLGHAVESITGYKKFTHGEAIAMGMVFAAERSVQKTGLSPKAVKRLIHLLQKAGLPTELPKFKKSDYRRAILQDKKRVSMQIGFVYLNRIGNSTVIPIPLEEII